MAVPHPFGLALSGGGFRATAFHLGVLKRLRELGLLAEVDVLSTVSGGSIAGAYWLYWQAKKGDTLKDDNQWNKFESSLIRAMKTGIRGPLFWKAFLAPLVILGLVSGTLVWFWGAVSLLTKVGLTFLIILAAYCVWHYTATLLLEGQYDELLFHGCKISDLSAPEDSYRQTKLPKLFINATDLVNGSAVLFKCGVRQTRSEVIAEIGERLMKDRETFGRDRQAFAIPMEAMDSNLSLARAVAASSALPGVFAPLRFWGPLDFSAQQVLSMLLGTPPPRRGGFLVTDGGVFDNQGVQILLESECRGLILSDAAAVLTRERNLSTWQLFPPRKGVVFRSQDIIYDRSRDLGYQRLADRHAMFRIIQQSGSDPERKATLLRQYSPVIEGYAYVELLPSQHFRNSLKDSPSFPPDRIPEELMRLVAAIRTDLDRFSDIEISALMLHGYSLIDHYLGKYNANWYSNVPLNFDFLSPAFLRFFKVSGPDNLRTIVIDPKLGCYLRISKSRVWLWRVFLRLISCYLIPALERAKETLRRL